MIKGFVAEGRVSANTLVAPLVGGTPSESWIALRHDKVLGSLAAPDRMRALIPTQAELPVTAAISDGVVVSVQIHQTFALTPAAGGIVHRGPRSPLYAAILSLMIPGLGQFYNGRAGRGFAFLAGVVLLWVYGLGWILNLVAAAEAYLDAQHLTLAYNRRQDGRGA
ncbi:DUF6677 family protein [Methylobacterium segetis]|uniref:DUF6677 family protein n=1 Tax=Methylobacterium segetis TaxID=2488750 RepID=UPI00104C0919|nr:DUF6677 family protein [Methylobacterium segetis]